jgi:uncharacterized protein
VPRFGTKATLFWNKHPAKQEHLRRSLAEVFMLRELTLRAILLTVSLSCLLHGKDIFGQAAAQESVKPQDPPKISFPSYPALRSKSKVVLVRHGCYGRCPQYTVTVFGNGRVLYEGEEFVRVKGRAKTNISHKALDDLIMKINEIDLFGYEPREMQACVEDAPHASITVSEPGREKHIEDQCIDGGQEIRELEAAIDKTVQIQRWIFIDAKELQNQIDEGWDVIAYGEEYARQAVGWNDPEVLRVLVKNGVFVDVRDEHGESLLIQAMRANKYAAAKALLELGANPNARDDDGFGAWTYAGSSIDMCKLFLTHGTSINDQDGTGGTMLMNAAASRNMESLEFLVNSGAQLNLRNHTGETAVGIAQRARVAYQELVDFTAAQNYPRWLGDPEAARAGYVAAQKEYEKVVEYLRQHGGME